jgi:hypothetical protein
MLGSFFYHHKTLESFVKRQTCSSEYKREVPDEAAVLGKVLEELMEVDRSCQAEVQAGTKSRRCRGHAAARNPRAYSIG